MQNSEKAEQMLKDLLASRHVFPANMDEFKEVTRDADLIIVNVNELYEDKDALITVSVIYFFTCCKI